MSAQLPSYCINHSDKKATRFIYLKNTIYPICGKCFKWLDKIHQLIIGNSTGDTTMKGQGIEGLSFGFKNGYLIISVSVGGGAIGPFLKAVSYKDGKLALFETQQRAWVDPEVWTVKIKLTAPKKESKK